MKRRKKMKLSVYDIGRLPLTEPKGTEGYQTWKEMKAESARLEQEERDRPAREAAAALSAAQAENLKLLREANRDFAAFWSQDIDTMDVQQAVFDHVGTYTYSDVPTTGEERRAALAEFDAALTNDGIDLFPKSRTKFGTFVAMLNHRGVAYTSANLAQAFMRFVESGIFVEGIDGTGLDHVQRPAVAKAAPVAPVVKPNFDHLGSDNPEWRRAVGAQWSEEVAVMFHAWTESMYKAWNYSFFADPNHVELTSRIGQYVTKWNLSLLRHETYNIIRRAFGKLGLMPLMLTDEERLADLIENSDMSDREVRKAIANHANILSGR